MSTRSAGGDSVNSQQERWAIGTDYDYDPPRVYVTAGSRIIADFERLEDAEQAVADHNARLTATDAAQEGETWSRVGPRGAEDGDWCPDPVGKHRHSWSPQGDEHATCIFCGKLGYKLHGIPWQEGEYTGGSNPGVWWVVDKLTAQLRAAQERIAELEGRA